jgi:hypothetical protein
MLIFPFDRDEWRFPPCSFPTWKVISKSVFEKKYITPLPRMPGKNIPSSVNGFHQSYLCYWPRDVIRRLV